MLQVGVESCYNNMMLFYTAAKAQEKQQIDAIAAVYIEQFSVKAQNMTCRRSISPRGTCGEIKVDCNKRYGAVTVYEVDTIEITICSN